MKNWKRYLSVAMTLVMLLGVLPTAAFAEGLTPSESLKLYLPSGENYTYTGDEIKPLVRVWIVNDQHGDKTGELLAPEYDVSYSNNINIATKESSNPPTVTVTPKAPYPTNPLTITFNINPVTVAVSENDFTLTNCTYTGSAVKPEVHHNGNKLTEGTDYTIQCTNNTNAGNATATVFFQGTYSGGPHSKTFQIQPKDISGATMGGLRPAYKPGERPEPVLNLDGYGQLRKDSDYELTHTETNTLTITAKGKNNYTGTVTATVPVLDDNTPPDISGVQNGMTYYEEKTITAMDLNLYKVRISRGTALVADLTPGTDGKVTHTLTPSATPYTIVAEDKVGNTTSITVTISKKPVVSSMITIADADNIVFDGKAKTPAITVQDSSATIADNQYTLSWQNNTNAGTATVKVTMNSDAAYKGEATKTFTIKPKALTAPTVEIPAQTYTGSALTPEPTVKDGETRLTKDTDYTVTYSNNTNAAAADAQNAPTATVKFKGNYAGNDVTKTFTISRKDISAAVLGGLNTTYNPGSRPVPTVTLDGNTLVEGNDKDYTLSYDETTTPGSLIITVTGRGNYTGSKQATVAVLATSDTTAPVISGVTNGGTYYEAKTITVTDTNLDRVEVHHNGSVSTSRPADTNPTTLSVNLAFSNTPYQIKAYDKVGNKTEFTVTVTKKSITSAMITIAGADNIVYDGTAKTPTITVKDGSTTIAADQYTLSWENNTNAGTATVKVTMNNNAAYKGEATKTFTIKPKALTSSAIQEIDDQTYTGSPITPTITVKYGTKTLEMGTDKDYTVHYSNNTNPGTAKVTVVLRGNYTGTLEKTFTIGKDLSALENNIKTLAAKTTLTYAEKQQIKQLKAAYDALSAADKATVDREVGSALMTSFKNKASAAAFKLLNKPSVDYYKYVKGTSSNVVIQIDADYSRTHVTEIRMGKNLTVIDPANYTVTEGSVVVTLSSSYLKQIKDAGKYNLYIDLMDTQTGHTETLQTVVRVVPATDIPQTGDPFRMNLWVGLLGASVLALAGLGVYEVVKKKKNAQKRLEAAMELGEEPSDEANTNE